MKPLMTIVAGLIAISGLNAQTKEQIENLSDRLESAWKTKSHQAFDALYCKDNADQFQIDQNVDSWVWKMSNYPKLKIVRFLNISELEKLADPQNGNSEQDRYREILGRITKPQVMNGHSYVQNLPAVGILDYNITRNGLTGVHSVAVGLNPDGRLQFTLQRRS